MIKATILITYNPRSLPLNFRVIWMGIIICLIKKIIFWKGKLLIYRAKIRIHSNHLRNQIDSPCPLKVTNRRISCFPIIRLKILIENNKIEVGVIMSRRSILCRRQIIAIKLISMLHRLIKYLKLGPHNKSLFRIQRLNKDINLLKK